MSKELETLVREYQALNSTEVDELDEFTVRAFGRQVALNRPAVVRDWGSKLPALQWTQQDLIEKVTEPFPVATTPDGRADSEHEGCFVEPMMSECLSMRELCARLSDFSVSQRLANGVTYFQSQNGCLTEPPFARLLPDVGADVDVATSYFGQPPDAANLWIGNRLSVTALHSDPYENLYLCIHGSKTFTLHPPIEFCCMHSTRYPPGRWMRDDSGDWHIQETGGEAVPWIPIDPLEPDLASYPRYALARAMRVTLLPGDMLYLPALWIHHVQQDGEPLSIAANWWYDMRYEAPVWSLHRLVRRLSLAVDGQQEEEQDVED